MRTGALFLGLVLLSVTSAQRGHPAPHGVIYGTVITSEGEPAKRLNLAAVPIGVGFVGALPHTKTNDSGEYRFENLTGWGKYYILGDDEKAGYSDNSIGNNQRTEVELTPERPTVEFNFSLPPKAGFIQIHLTNRRTGRAIPSMIIAVGPMERPDARLFTDPLVFTVSCYSDRVILVPPDENLLLHVESDGFREWDESVGKGKPVNVPSGNLLTLKVQLDPIE
jgi:hypothetical protein